MYSQFPLVRQATRSLITVPLLHWITLVNRIAWHYSGSLKEIKIGHDNTKKNIFFKQLIPLSLKSFSLLGIAKYILFSEFSPTLSLIIVNHVLMVFWGLFFCLTSKENANLVKIVLSIIWVDPILYIIQTFFVFNSLWLSNCWRRKNIFQN